MRISLEIFILIMMGDLVLFVEDMLRMYLVKSEVCGDELDSV